MKRKIKVSASILCADFNKLGDEIKKCEDAQVDELHIDIMDGHFVPVISMGPMIIKTIRPLTKLPINAHLMVSHPGMHIEECIEAGVDSLSVHAECYGELREGNKNLGQFPKEVDSIDKEKILKDLDVIHKKGKKGFIVLNPGTPMCLKPVVGDMDGVLVMSVNPGFARQKFMPEVLSKVKELREIFDGEIAIDGGLNGETSPLAVEAGVDIIATASYFFGAKEPKDVVKNLKSLGA